MTLTVLINVLLAILVIVTLLFALNKYSSVQNIEKLKTLKEISLNIQAIQLLSYDVNIEQKELNYSLNIEQDKISSGNIDYNFKIFKEDFSFNCNLELTTIKTVEGETEYKKPYPIFVKEGNQISCINKNE